MSINLNTLNECEGLVLFPLWILDGIFGISGVGKKRKTNKKVLSQISINAKVSSPTPFANDDVAPASPEHYTHGVVTTYKQTTVHHNTISIRVAHIKDGDEFRDRQALETEQSCIEEGIS